MSEKTAAVNKDNESLSGFHGWFWAISRESSNKQYLRLVIPQVPFPLLGFVCIGDKGYQIEMEAPDEAGRMKKKCMYFDPSAVVFWCHEDAPAGKKSNLTIQ